MLGGGCSRGRSSSIYMRGQSIHWAQRWYGRIMHRLRPWLFLSVIYVRDLRGEELKTPPNGFTARFVNKDELLKWCEDPSLDLSTEFVETAVARGNVCTGMFYGERLVAYMWRSTSLTPHVPGVCVETQKPYRYGYKVLTLEEYRGRHIPEYLAPLANRYYIERGYTFSIGFVETHNFSSRRSELRRGSYSAGYAGYISVFNMRVTFRTRGVRETGFRFVSG